MFRNPLSRTTRIGTVATAVALAGLSLAPMHSSVSAASRTTIAPAPLAPVSIPAPAVAVLKPAAPRKPRLPLLTGFASWYGAVLHGHRSADGGVFDETELTAAHQTLPFGTHVKVLDLNTGRSVVVRITDRGAFSPGRIIDLSSAAADSLGILRSGIAHVRLEVLQRTAIPIGEPLEPTPLD